MSLGLLRSVGSVARRSFPRNLTHANASTLVIAEHDNSTLSPSTLSVVTAASKLGEVDILVAGFNCEAVSSQAAAMAGVGKIITGNDASLETGLAENFSRAVAAAVKSKGYSHVMAPSSNFTKNYLPRVAIELDSAPMTDVVEILGEDTFVRPMYAGNSLATIKSQDSVKLLSIRTTAFDKCADSGGSAEMEDLVLEGTCDAELSAFKSASASESERPDLTAASVVVSGGRGMKSGENFGMLEELADKLGGAVGASRAAVDAGYVPNELQVGQTGKVVAPDLYMAVGISGAIQHLSGMKDSKTIVAINKDAEAPIFQVADYGLVQDLFNAVPEITSKV